MRSNSAAVGSSKATVPKNARGAASAAAARPRLRAIATIAASFGKPSPLPIVRLGRGEPSLGLPPGEADERPPRGLRLEAPGEEARPVDPKPLLGVPEREPDHAPDAKALAVLRRQAEGLAEVAGLALRLHRHLRPLAAGRPAHLGDPDRLLAVLVVAHHPPRPLDRAQRPLRGELVGVHGHRVEPLATAGAVELLQVPVHEDAVLDPGGAE